MQKNIQITSLVFFLRNCLMKRIAGKTQGEGAFRELILFYCTVRRDSVGYLLTSAIPRHTVSTIDYSFNATGL